jgi:hypothetical protein
MRSRSFLAGALSMGAWPARPLIARTPAVFSGNEADTDPLADFPFGYSAAQRFNAANYFVPGNARQS